MHFPNIVADELLKTAVALNRLGAGAAPNNKHPKRYDDTAIWEIQSTGQLIRGPLAQVLEKHGCEMTLLAV